MKFTNLLILIFLHFSLIKSLNNFFYIKSSKVFNQFGRKLTNSYNKTIMLVGFSEYEIKKENTSFVLNLKTYYNFPLYKFLYINISLYYQNNDILDKEIECFYNKTDNNDNSDIKYYCESFIDYLNFSRVEFQNYNFIFNNNSNENFTLNEEEIEESSLSKETRYNISTQSEKLLYSTFYLGNITISNNEVILNGDLIGDYKDEKVAELTLSNSIFLCSINKNEIRFNLKEMNINEGLSGKMAYVSDIPKILIFAKGGINDIFIYYENIISNNYVELIGFFNYKDPTNNKDATVTLYLRGPNLQLSNLKKYIRFTAEIDDGTTIINETVNGIKNNDLANNIISYNISILNSSGKTGITINSMNDYSFSDNEIDFTDGLNQIDIFPEITVISIKENLIFNMIENFNEPMEYTSDSFSLDFNFSSTDLKLNIINNSKAYINYIPIGKTIRDEIECFTINETTFLSILCSPKKSIYTSLNTLIIKILIEQSEGKLRLLEPYQNITFFAPIDAKGMIEFEYNLETTPLEEKESQKKSLSAVAIIAIIIGIIIVISTIGITILLFKRQINSSFLKNSKEFIYE